MTATAAYEKIILTGFESLKDRLIQAVADNFDASISSQNKLINAHSRVMMKTASDKNNIEMGDGPATFPPLLTEDSSSIPLQDIQIERNKGPKKSEILENEALLTVLPLYILAQKLLVSFPGLGILTLISFVMLYQKRSVFSSKYTTMNLPESKASDKTASKSPLPSLDRYDFI